VVNGFESAVAAAWAKLDIKQMLLDTVVNLFWPPATIRAIGHEFSELWNTDWANAAGSLFACRSPLDDFWGWVADVWSNVLILLDFPLALWRRLNNVLMLLMGYITLLLVLAGAIVGGVLAAPAGVLPGVLAGAAAGLELAATLGEGLLVSYFWAEGISVVKALVDLFTARQTQEEKQRDYVQMTASLLGMAVAAVIVAVLALLSGLVGAIASAVRGGKAPPAPTPGGDAGAVAKSDPVKVEPPKTEPPKTEPPKTEPATQADKVSEVPGKPNTYKIADSSAIEATKPSRLQGPLNKAFWHWELTVRLPNGEVAVFCEINIRFRGSPDLNLFPKEAIVKGTGRVVNLEAAGFKWTTEALRAMLESYEAKFGAPPENLGGWLAKSNLRNFQTEFARIRAAKPNASLQEIAQEAVRSISFGKQRLPLGYEHFYVTMLKFQKALIDGVEQNVPSRVRVEASKAPVELPVARPPVPPASGYGEGDEGD
jgi:hypothetical protein